MSTLVNIILIICIIALFIFDDNCRNIAKICFEFLMYHIGFLANVVKVLGIFSIIFVYLNYRKSLRWKRFDYSIKVINEFRSSIIPHIVKASKEFPEKLQQKRRNIINAAKDEYFKEHPARRKSRGPIKIYFNRPKFDAITYNSTENECFYSIMNELEQLAIYDEKHIIDDNLAYREMHSVFLRFFDKHKRMLDYMSNRDATYAACHYLIRHWKRKRENHQWLQQK